MGDVIRPDFSAQFREPYDNRERVYMGGTTIGCGDRPKLPKRHKWGPWEQFWPHGGWEQTCKNCGLVGEAKWFECDPNTPSPQPPDRK